MRRLVAAALLAAAAGPLAAQDVTPPAEHLGHPVGADFRLADWEQVSGYFRGLAAQSPRVLVERVGTTTEGRPFLLATISSPENLARLDAVRQGARRLADPRGLDPAERAALVEETPLVLFVSCAMHSTETAAPQMAMELAWLLATSDAEPWAGAREELVVLIAPTLNPDGLDHVVRWYRETVDTPHEGAWLTRLYQHYAGHDNNRDWFGLTQAETRIVTRLLYSEWFPQVYWDVHQQGGGRERFFVPPYRDPLNPNLDPAIIAGIDALGSRALLDMTRDGLSGVSTGVTYDMWWNGGNRNVPVRHNIMGLLTEAASVEYASPVFLPPDELEAPRGLGGYAPSNRFPDPWPGGWWRLRDIIDYELGFARSLLGSLARERPTWLENAVEAAERALAAGREGFPRGWVIPSTSPDRGAVRRLVDGLLLGGVEVHAAADAFEADGRTWPAGSLVIPRAQPYGAHVKDLFEVQRYPEGDPPYDVAGWTLPLLFGVRRAQLSAIPAGLGEPVADAEAALAGFPAPADGGPWPAGDSDTWARIFGRLAAGGPVRFATAGPEAGAFRPGAAGPADAEAGWVTVGELPRVGVYAPWWGSKNEGWLRWVLDTWGVPYQTVRNETLRAGRLDEVLDVLILPSMDSESLDAGRTPGTVPDRFARGLAPEGAAAVEELVRTGGTVIALGRSSEWLIDLLDLPLRDATRPEDPPEDFAFSCPGSVLRTIPTPGSPFTAGLPPSVAVFFSRSIAFAEAPPGADEAEEEGFLAPAPAAPEVEALLRYAPSHVLLSGWIEGPGVLADRPAWLRVRHGAGRVHLFGFRPQYRGWSQQAFQLLFRALVLEGRGR